MPKTGTPQGGVRRVFHVTREPTAPHNAGGWSGLCGRGDASADTPSRTRLRQGRLPGATVRTSWCFVIRAQGYTQSHSDKPDCVRNDYSPAITLTPSRPPSLPYVVAPVQGNHLTEKDGNRTACSCEVHYLYNCA